MFNVTVFELVSSSVKEKNGVVLIVSTREQHKLIRSESILIEIPLSDKYVSEGNSFFLLFVLLIHSSVHLIPTK